MAWLNFYGILRVFEPVFERLQRRKELCNVATTWKLPSGDDMYRPGWLCCGMDLEDLEDLEVFTFISYSCYLVALPFPDLA